MTTRDKIESLDMAIADAEEALRDDAYFSAKTEEPAAAHINGFITECKRQRTTLKTLLPVIHVGGRDLLIALTGPVDHFGELVMAESVTVPHGVYRATEDRASIVLSSDRLQGRWTLSRDVWEWGQKDHRIEIINSGKSQNEQA